MNSGKKKKIVWVRHTAPDVIPGTCYGQTDVPLKASFEEEASKCAAQLKKYSFQKAYTSPLSRCTRLAGRGIKVRRTAEEILFPESIHQSTLTLHTACRVLRLQGSCP